MHAAQLYRIAKTTFEIPNIDMAALKNAEALIPRFKFEKLLNQGIKTRVEERKDKRTSYNATRNRPSRTPHRLAGHHRL